MDKISFEEVEVLEFEGIKYQLHIQRFHLVLKMCKSLKILRIFWVGYHARLKKDFFESIFETCEGIQELHIGYKTDTFELTDDILETIKTKGKGLKKLTTFSENLNITREKMRTFNNTGVKCTVLDKNYENSVHKEYNASSKLTSTCLWTS